MDGFSKHLIVIAGPTAVGKTSTAIAVAEYFKTEIISADSRQFYKEMSIGTAVPSITELLRVKHHFIQHLSVNETYDVAEFEKDTVSLLEKHFINNNSVVLTGGSGLFIDAVCNGIDPMPDIFLEIREKVNNIFLNEGLSRLQQLTEEVDPTYFRTVDKQNPRRLQRALEVFFQTGNNLTFYRNTQKKTRNFRIIRIGLERDRFELIERINERTDLMLQEGLQEEVAGLVKFRYLNALNTVGYKEFFDYFDNKITLSEVPELIKIATRQYAKRQMTWFKKNEAYQWFHPDHINDIIQFISLNMHNEVTSEKQ